MYWISADQLRSIDNPNRALESDPKQRWGQSCVAAHNKLYTIGGYDGQYLKDVWEFNFEDMKFQEIILQGPDVDALERSNHTSIFYPPHNSIYVFGGGHAQRARYNDTLRLQLQEPEIIVSNGQSVIEVSRVEVKENSLMPSQRTYHASCLLGKYMIVIGGEASSDLKDLWAFDLEEREWFQPEINYEDVYTPKRFLTVCATNDHQVITFGGCHSEYVHLNEMHIFEMKDFLADPKNPQVRLICKKVNVTQGVPSTRWGHAASTYNGRLYIVGGRNDQDVIDIHEFNPEAMTWRELEVSGPLPKPRRRHSAVFVSGSLLLFGGFDGNFYNDLQILDFQSGKKQIIKIQQSSISQEYRSLVDTEDKSDLTFILDNVSQSRVYGHKPLILFRLINREYQEAHMEEVKISEIVKRNTTPEFIRRVYLSNSKDEIYLPDVTCKNTFLNFLEFIYCDTFADSMTVFQVKKVAELCKTLNLTNSFILLKKKCELARIRIQSSLTKEINLQAASQGAQQQPRLNTTHIKEKVDSLEQHLKLDFNIIDDIRVNSPEDKHEKLHNKAITHMNQCKNLDEFYDILFMVDDTLIKANSLVLSARCPYFQSMLSNKYSFQESSIKPGSSIKVQGVPKNYFSCIIQYIYSDHFYIQKQDPEFFIKLLIYADYFMLPRLIDICSSYLKRYVNIKTVLSIYLLAHAHNAQQLESYCINFIAMNETEVLEGRQFRSFKRQVQDSLLQRIFDSLNQEKIESYVQICINSYLKVRSPMLKLNETGTKELYPSFTKTNIFQGDIDIVPMLQTADYIYLEEHEKLESYDLLKVFARLPVQQLSQKNVSNPRSSWVFQEEEKKSSSSNQVSQDCLSSRSLRIQTKQQRQQQIIDSQVKENINPNEMQMTQLPKTASRKKHNFVNQSLSGLSSSTNHKNSVGNSKENCNSQAGPLRPRVNSGGICKKKDSQVRRQPLRAIKQTRPRGDDDSSDDLEANRDSDGQQDPIMSPSRMMIRSSTNDNDEFQQRHLQSDSRRDENV